MSPEQREANFRKLERYVFKYTSAWWGQSFVTELTRISAGEDGKENKDSDKAKLALKNAAEGVAGAATKAI
jgi:trehalose 6-phosphate synthase